MNSSSGLPDMCPVNSADTTLAVACGHRVHRPASATAGRSAGHCQRRVDREDHQAAIVPEHGSGVDADQELAFKYYRKAADLGNPEGQYLVGDSLNDRSKHGPEIAAIGLAMQRCAADQGHAKAANEYAIDVRQDGKLSEAMKYLHLATKAGQAEAGHRLSEAFGKNQDDPIYDLGQVIDPERQERYEKVWKFLADYSYLNPKVPELDTIAPLPPAKLPPWDGKFKWLEEYEANVPPPLPTEERIAEMAKAKGLDPKTGRRLEQQK